MANLEQISMARQTIQNVVGLRANIRSNCLNYKQQLADKTPAAKVFSILQGDVSGYQRRIKMQADVMSAPARKARLEAGLQAHGIDDMINFRDELILLKSVVDDLATTTEETIVTRSDAALSALPEYDKVY
jgi:hypothetical protein